MDAVDNRIELLSAMTEIQTNSFILNKNKNSIRNFMGTSKPHYAIYNNNFGNKRSELRLSDITGNSKSVFPNEINYESITETIKNNNNNEMSQNGLSNNPEHIGKEPYLLNQQVLINFPNNQKTSCADNSSQQSDNFISFQLSPRPKYCENGSNDGQHKIEMSQSKQENIKNIDLKQNHDYEMDESKQMSNDPSVNDEIIVDHISEEPSHHARRPMNAFLIFCKRHRSVVRERYPSLENRAVTKILGEWWAQLDQDDKASYTALAKQYKDAFFSANPNFKWYKLPAPPLRTLNTRPSNVTRSGNPSSQATGSFSEEIYVDPSPAPSSIFTPGKLADETQLGNLNSLINPYYNNKTDNAEKSTDESENFESKYTNINNNILFDESGNKSPCIDFSLKSASEEFSKYFQTPNNGTSNEKEIPPKPPKKRFINEMSTSYNNKNIVRNIFEKDFQNNDSENQSSQAKQYLQDASRNIENSNENINSNKNPFFNLRTYALSSAQSSSYGKPNELSSYNSDSNSDDSKSDFQCQSTVTELKNDSSESSNDHYKLLHNTSEKIKPENLTQQQLIDRVVDRMCGSANKFSASGGEIDPDTVVSDVKCKAVNSQSSKGIVRTSVRSCKGKRYAEFMVENKLIVNKRGRKNNPLNVRTPGTKKFKHRAKQRTLTEASYHHTADTVSENKAERLYIDLNETIQKLSNRTQNVNNFRIENPMLNDTGTNLFHNCKISTESRKRTISEASDDSVSKKMFRAADFNLNEKIEALPSLSLEKFQQKKKENKKKKRLISSSSTKRLLDYSSDSKLVENCYANENSHQETNNNVTLTGSRKRKARKQSITHLEVSNNVPATVSSSEPDLFGLTTLAEVALNSDKLKSDINNE